MRKDEGTTCHRQVLVGFEQGILNSLILVVFPRDKHEYISFYSALFGTCISRHSQEIPQLGRCFGIGLLIFPHPDIAFTVLLLVFYLTGSAFTKVL